MKRTYTFNRIWTLLMIVPLLFMAYLLFGGVLREFSILVLVMFLVTTAMVVPILYLAFLRKLRVTDEHAEWITPRARHKMALSEIQHIGIIRFRRFRFLYISRAKTSPFTDEERAVVSDQDTFLIQYRESAWKHISEWVASAHPDLKSEEFHRQ